LKFFSLLQAVLLTVQLKNNVSILEFRYENRLLKGETHLVAAAPFSSIEALSSISRHLCLLLQLK